MLCICAYVSTDFDSLLYADLMVGMLGERILNFAIYRKNMEPITFYPGQLEATASTGTPLVAQYFDQDLIGSTGEMLHEFYESGQLWALLIGVALGYIIKSAFSYG